MNEAGMKCPQCSTFNNKILQTRSSPFHIKRRRQCLDCEARWTTYERVRPCNPVEGESV
ncbi:hypothetical protein [Funiculus sociatus]|uniref:NrdR family transcriptional regulator n=1 Tax=Funiculus sociatus TaxID=450527 RepID=UPI0019865AB4|nr:hypothetical protein [Trichocoleus sp. FACHB-40]